MPTIRVELETVVAGGFEVEQLASLFDVELAERSRRVIEAEVPGLEREWRVGAIVGESGMGKSTAARRAAEVVGGRFVERPRSWSADRPVAVDLADAAGLLASPSGKGVEGAMQRVCSVLSAVGFSSPPAWVLPYRVLSTGQRFRCDLAASLLDPTGDGSGRRGLVWFDEFTSVVDRTVGRVGSVAVSKAVCRGELPCERFVAVTCHEDVVGWLGADWVLNMATGRLDWGSVRRPSVELRWWRVARARIGALWRVFRPHHYLSGKLSAQARVYAATVHGELVGGDLAGRVAGFCATLQNAGFAGRRMVHRLVVLPDFQGLGAGLRLLEAVAAAETAEGYVLGIRTSHPALVASLRRRAGWADKQVVRVAKGHTQVAGLGSCGRSTAGFDWVGGA